MSDKEIVFSLEIKVNELERMLDSCCGTVMSKEGTVDKLAEIRSLLSELH